MVSFSCSLHPILGRPVLKAPLELLWGPSLWQPGSSRDHHFVFKRLKVFEPPSLRFLGMEINYRLYVELNYVDICLVGNLVSHKHHQNTEGGPINALWPTPMPNACFTRRRMAAPSSWSTRAPGGSRLCPVWWAELVRSTFSETCLTGKPEFGRMVMWMAVVFSSNLGQFHMFSHFQLQEVCAPLWGSGQAPWGYRALVALGAMAWTWVTWMIFLVFSPADVIPIASENCSIAGLDWLTPQGLQHCAESADVSNQSDGRVQGSAGSKGPELTAGHFLGEDAYILGLLMNNDYK